MRGPKAPIRDTSCRCRPLTAVRYLRFVPRRDTLCWGRERGDNRKWRNALNSYLTNNKEKFLRPRKFYW